jgi:glycosyltransferase involved in cell wall biosynthesis
MAKNQGQTFAMQAGIDYSKGDTLVFLDADLQNNPEDIPRLIEKIDSGYDVVSGWRKERKDPLLSKRLPSSFGNWFISRLFHVNIHDIGCTLKAYKREVLSGIRLYGDMHRLLPLVAVIKGASFLEIAVSHSPRHRGKTHYGWSRIYRFVFDLITIRFFETYATKPIYVFGGFGIVFITISAFLSLFIIVRKMFIHGVWISPLLFISLMFFGIGVHMVLMGLLAEVVTRMYYKPNIEKPYLVKEIINERR